MNTEIFDYFKELAKKEFFVINLIDSILGVVIIVMGITALNDGISELSYAIMFAAGATMFALNTVKGFKRKSKNRFIFLLLAVMFLMVAVMFAAMIFIG